MGLRAFLDDIEPLFARGGRLHKFEALYEMVDTLLYTPSSVTRRPARRSNRSRTSSANDRERRTSNRS